MNANDFQTSWEAQRKMQSEVVAANKQSILEALKAAGIESVEVYYCGGGDSGGVESVDITPAERATDIVVQMQSIRSNWNEGTTTYSVDSDEEGIESALESLAYDAIEASNNGGWENNEGGYGYLRINVADGTMKLEHTNYIQTEDTSETEF